VALKNMSAIETIDSSAAIPKSSISWVIVTIFVFSSLLVVNYLRPPDNRQLEEWGFVAVIDPSRIGSVHARHHEGHEINRDFFVGQWSLVFFGFTYCPDVCPMTLSVLKKVSVELGTDAPRVVMVSVDPERDTLPVLSQYIQAFSDEFHGLTGDMDQIQVLANEFHVVFAQSQSQENYMVNHTTNVGLINPRGEYVGHFRIPHRPEQIVRVLETLMQCHVAQLDDNPGRDCIARADLRCSCGIGPQCYGRCACSLNDQGA
tara:strand:- start:173 stop:952 length:780 start_codon:yes stop_codon:yes gene_type:complete